MINVMPVARRALWACLIAHRVRGCVYLLLRPGRSCTGVGSRSGQDSIHTDAPLRLSQPHQRAQRLSTAPNPTDQPGPNSEPVCSSSTHTRTPDSVSTHIYVFSGCIVGSIGSRMHLVFWALSLFLRFLLSVGLSI